MKTRLQMIPVEEIAKNMVNPVTTNFGYQFATPAGVYTKYEEALKMTIDWLNEEIDEHSKQLSVSVCDFKYYKRFENRTPIFNIK